MSLLTDTHSSTTIPGLFTDITGTGTRRVVVVVVEADVSYWVTVSSAKDLITEDVLTLVFCYEICQYNNFLVLILFTQYATTRLDGQVTGTPIRDDD